PMQRWEMAVALVNALNATTKKTQSGEPEEDASSTWLAKYWGEKPSDVYEGAFVRVRGGRIYVGDRSFKYDTHATNGTPVLFNGADSGLTVTAPLDQNPHPGRGKGDIPGAAAALRKDQLVHVVLGDEDDVAEEINILFDDYSDDRLTRVNADRANSGT